MSSSDFGAKKWIIYQSQKLNVIFSESPGLFQSK